MGRVEIPAGIRQTVPGMLGAEGVTWLDALPATVQALAEGWQLQLGEPFPDLWLNYVAPARRDDGREVVLKLCAPTGEFPSETGALQAYGGEGAVRLLELDEPLGAMLLERVTPGEQLLTIEDDEERTRIASGVMRRITRPAPAQHPFPTAAEWAWNGMRRLRATFEGGTGPFPRRLVERAETLFADLFASAGEPVILHGDLHHLNILASERGGWLAIDPKGVVGEREYETGALLRNPPDLLSYPNLSAIQARRIAILAEELSLDRERIRDWGVAQAVLSAWWSYEDTGTAWEHGLRVAETLADLKP